MVLVIMVALAAVLLVVADLEINEKTPEQIATEATMQAIRDAIMGKPGQPGAWADLGQQPEWFPPRVDDLRHEFETVSDVSNYMNYAGIEEYNPVTRIGWRGPYIMGQLLDAWGNPFQIQIDFDNNGQIDGAPNYFASVGIANGNEATFARLVSAGEDGIVDTPLNVPKMPPSGFAASLGLAFGLTHADCGDDIVLFFQIPDTRQ